MDRSFARIVARCREQGYTLANAWDLAKRHGAAVKRASAFDLVVSWDDDDLPWDGDCEAPALLMRATVLHPDHADADTSDVSVRFPFFDRKDGTVGRTPAVLAALGGIGLDSMRDAYVWDVEADLLDEACDVLDAERDALACQQAAELASRATFAAGSAVQS